MRVAVVGLGLIGGSMALALKKADPSCELIGVDMQRAHRNTALKRNMVDRVMSLERAVIQVDLVVLAVPVHTACALLLRTLDLVGPLTWIVDVGSTKMDIVAAANSHRKRSQFVAAHPIAGTAHSGPQSALVDLFFNKVCVLSALSESDTRAVALVSSVWELLGMQVIEMDAATHDSQVARVSHLSHLLSFALAQSVLKGRVEGDQLDRLAGSGLASTVRLAQSSSALWTPIFAANQAAVLRALADYQIELDRLKNLLEKDCWDELTQYINQANAIEQIVNK